MNRIILASASPRRRELLSQIGLDFTVLPSCADEDITGFLPEEMVKELSARKALDVYDRLTKEGEKEFVVIGADTVVSLEDTIMGKPKDEKEAVYMLGRLQGQVHQVYTGVTLVKSGERDLAFSFAEQTDVIMFPMSREEIQSYVASGEPMDKAGAYGIQGKCAAFIRGIKGDYNNVVGLPIGRLFQEMKSRGMLYS